MSRRRRQNKNLFTPPCLPRSRGVPPARGRGGDDDAITVPPSPRTGSHRSPRLPPTSIASAADTAPQGTHPGQATSQTTGLMAHVLGMQARSHAGRPHQQFAPRTGQNTNPDAPLPPCLPAGPQRTRARSPPPPRRTIVLPHALSPTERCTEADKAALAPRAMTIPSVRGFGLPHPPLLGRGSRGRAPRMRREDRQPAGNGVVAGGFLANTLMTFLAGCAFAAR